MPDLPRNRSAVFRTGAQRLADARREHIRDLRDLVALTTRQLAEAECELVLEREKSGPCPAIGCLGQEPAAPAQGGRSVFTSRSQQ